MAMKAHNEVAPAPTGDVPPVDGSGAATSTVSKKRSAGFWAVLFMVIGNQFGGLSTVWSLGAAQGLKKLLLAHALIGFMYVLLSFCFAELTSMVPFAGGSFGFCRAALGPFWGFLVGASEVVENALKVVVCVYLIGTACSATFKTDQQFEPFWHLICYILLYGIHLRGGMLLWFSMIVLGVFSIAIVMIFCIGNSKDIDVHKYGQLDASSFTGNTDSYLETFVLPIWIYIGLEIVPQTCERVKNVNRNLPWALVIGNMFTYLFSFWVLIVVTCSYPGMANSSMWITNAFPFTFGFDHLFNTHFKMYGPAFAILTTFASALTFMWGCGHQLASLAQSGLVPSIFAKTFGENEAPIVALTVTTIAQYAICVGLQQGNATRGINACYSAMMIGASMVYVGMFASFIVFRVRFDGMKRHWISPLGIPGAAIGIGLALLLVVIELVIIADAKPLIVYFVYMGAAILYYIFYASHHQYFSKEEQKQFMKAYILNANKGRKTTGGHRKAPHTPLQRMMDTVWEPLAQWFGLSSTLFGNTTHHNTTTAASPSLMTHATKQTHVSKINTVAPAPAPAPLLVAPVGASVSPMDMVLANSNKAVGEVRSTELTSMVNGKSAKVVSTRQVMTTTTSTKTNNLRASWAAASGSTKVSWSGKAMTMTESKKFLEVLMSAPEDVANQLVESLPNQFVSLGVDEAAVASTKMEAGDEVLLPEIVEGITDDDDDDDDDNDNGNNHERGAQQLLK